MNGTTRSRGRGGVAGWAGQHKESIEKETLRARRYSLGPCGVKQIRWGFLFCLFVCLFFCVCVGQCEECVCVCVWLGFFCLFRALSRRHPRPKNPSENGPSVTTTAVGAHNWSP